MRKLTLTCILVALVLGINAQQRPLTTLFMTNPIAINPAIAGTYNYFQVISNHRFQWVGFNDAPITNTLSFFGPTANFPMGWGGTITYDITGPSSIGSIHGSYAYYYTVNEDIKVSMGLNLGVLQYKIDIPTINLEEDGDPIENSNTTHYLPDATVGAYFYSSTYHVGMVATNLFNSKVKNVDEAKIVGRVKTHFYFTGGYYYNINREWAVEPTLILKKVAPAPFQLDFNVRGWYRNMVWGGLSYRTGEALSVLAGYIYEKKIQIGYSYDIVIGPIGKYNNGGSHEIILNYKFDRLKD